jgi:hypothetical protein
MKFAVGAVVTVKTVMVAKKPSFMHNGGSTAHKVKDQR